MSVKKLAIVAIVAAGTLVAVVYGYPQGLFYREKPDHALWPEGY